jgi:enoyl-CoA hydratase/carnithine racemase
MLMILSGEQISAREAYDMGLVSRLVPRAELSGAVGALARTLAGLSPMALGLAKEAAATVAGMEYGASLRYLREMIWCAVRRCARGHQGLLREARPTGRAMKLLG